MQEGLLTSYCPYDLFYGHRMLQTMKCEWPSSVSNRQEPLEIAPEKYYYISIKEIFHDRCFIRVAIMILVRLALQSWFLAGATRLHINIYARLL